MVTKQQSDNIHYENLPMQHTEIFCSLKIENFQLKKLIFFLFLLKTYMAVLTSTHNVCFGAKIRKNRYTPAYLSFAI